MYNAEIQDLHLESNGTIVPTEIYWNRLCSDYENPLWCVWYLSTYETHRPQLLAHVSDPNELYRPTFWPTLLKQQWL